jgi:hypothetical protein
MVSAIRIVPVALDLCGGGDEDKPRRIICQSSPSNSVNGDERLGFRKLVRNWFHGSIILRNNSRHCVLSEG